MVNVTEGYQVKEACGNPIEFSSHKHTTTLHYITTNDVQIIYETHIHTNIHMHNCFNMLAMHAQVASVAATCVPHCTNTMVMVVRHGANNCYNGNTTALFNTTKR